MNTELLKSISKERSILIGNRIPKDFFITSGVGQSDITIHAGSYHLALKAAGIERCNIINYSSILPAIATEVERPSDLVHGSVMETITACSNASCGQTATAGIIFGWLYDRLTGEKYGGLVCEYNGHDSEKDAIKSLKASLNELYTNGFEEEYEMRDIKVISRSFVPDKKFGTALVALCFTNYVYPIVE
jgi:arginine decarboxylase